MMAAGASAQGNSGVSERLNALCPYFTMFPLAVPFRHLRNAPAATWVLDPFCGRGTTNFAARLRGLPSVGVDSNPVAAAIAEGKLVDVTADAVTAMCRTVLATGDEEEPVPDGAFWKLAYHPRTLKQLVQLRSALLHDCREAPRKALRALLLGLLHGPRNKRLPSYLSNQMPRTFAPKPDYSIRYWKKHALRPAYVDLLELVERKARYYFASVPDSRSYHIVCADSRTADFTVLQQRFSRVITSPPYYGMRTYVPDQWIRNWFVGGPATVQYRQPEQLSHRSPGEFAEQLGMIWSNVASACADGAQYAVRFGGIHDRRATPKSILMASLEAAGRRMRVMTIRSAGLSSVGKRQADQFQRKLNAPIEELDYFIRLEG